MRYMVLRLRHDNCVSHRPYIILRQVASGMPSMRDNRLVHSNTVYALCCPVTFCFEKGNNVRQVFECIGSVDYLMVLVRALTSSERLEGRSITSAQT